jgi:hypothetical protein
LVTFEIAFHIFPWTSLDHNLIDASHITGMIGKHHHIQLWLIEMEPQELFAQAGLKLQSSQSLPPHWLGSQVWTTTPSQTYFFKICEAKLAKFNMYQISWKLLGDFTVCFLYFLHT